MRILIVADVAPIAVGLQHFLASEGFATATAWSADAAIEMLRSDPTISIVIWDLALRRTANIKRTITVAAKIERLNDNGYVKPPGLIFLAGQAEATASSNERDLRQLAHLISPGNVVSRPPDRSELLRKIRELSYATSFYRELVGVPRPSRTPTTPTEPRSPEKSHETSPIEIAPNPGEHSAAYFERLWIDAQMYILECSQKRTDATLEALISRLQQLEAQSHKPKAWRRLLSRLTSSGENS